MRRRGSPLNARRAMKGSGTDGGPFLRMLLVVSLVSGSSLAQDGREAASTPGDASETAGVPWTGDAGITETVSEIMAREARGPAVPAPPREGKPFLRRPTPPKYNPSAPAVAQWPRREEGAVTPDQA